MSKYSAWWRRVGWPRVDGYGVLALVLTVFAWAPLLGPDYFMGAHDARHTLFFPIEFDKGIRDGFWLPRWGPDFAHGYGYPVFVFYAPLTFYLWESFHLTGLFGVVASSKATFVVGFWLAAAGMYAYGRALWGRRAGLLAAVVYTYLPYHLLNIYVRAAMAEFVVMGLLPWIALAFRRLIRRPSLLGVAAAGGSYGALLLAHNITAVLFTLLLGALILFESALLVREYQQGAGAGVPWVAVARRHLLPVMGAVGLGVMMGTAMWIPSVAEQKDIRISQWVPETYQYDRHFVEPGQLLTSPWGFGYSVPGPGDGMSFQLGVVALVLAGVGVGSLGDGGRATADKGYIVFFALSLACLVGLVVPQAGGLWDVSPLSGLVQFPWRLLAVACVPLALLAGSAAPVLARLGGGGHQTPALVLALLCVLVAHVGYTQPPMSPVGDRDETVQGWREFETKHPDMVGMVAQTKVQPTDSPMVPALEANAPPQRFEAVTPGITITQRHVGGGSASAVVEASQPGTIRFLTYWYPGWYATLDGVPVEIRPDGGPLGLILLDIPAGRSILELRFGDTPLRRGANMASLASMLILGVLVLVGTWRRVSGGNVS